MAKKDAVSKRLAEEKALAELLKKNPLFTQEDLLAALPAPEELPAPPAPEELPALLQLEGPCHGGLGSYGNAAERDAAERPILDAFKAFGLDHRSLSDWRALVFHLAHVLFPTPRPAGRPRKWPDERLCELLADVAAYKRKKPEASDVAICNVLAKKWSTKPRRLRRILQDAGNPARNRVLPETALALMTPQLRAAAAAGEWRVNKDAPWTEADEKKLRSRVIWWAIQNADKLWGH
jgi:hypothetical protein